MANVIKKHGPDIVGLNEIRGKGTLSDYEAQTEILAELSGYKYFKFGEAIKVDGTNPYGNAFLSKLPIEKAQTVMIPDPVNETGDPTYETRCLLKITLEGGLNIIVTHFGLNPDEQKNAVSSVVAEITDTKCILMGDFNVTPDSPILTPIREKMKDTAELFSEPLMSFPSHEPNRKIDYIFVSRDITVISADIPSDIASDHRPHIATIEI